ncbi:aminotransferase class I/II-fold pyridoxal phosphate-dependent enzyme [Plantactinospora sp. WMMB334]|uniref:aminotransferase class I/II-fold pyridoxal phosphate-dependent enzyme n=1 Tax=Plantactinospora sp. WMMB334 TaxID=3404119 RepID=UPI003B93267A
MLQLIASAIDDRTARGVAAAVSRLVRTGELPPGSRLPTVRSVARELGISPTTVSEAWRSLASAGAIQTRGRSGTFVLPPNRLRQSLRYARLSANPATLPHDFSTGVPDHDLLPDLAPALRRIGDTRLTTSYLEEPVLPRLEVVLRERWPFPPQQLTVVDGALDGVDRVVGAAVRLGDRVLVENPTFPPLLDLLDTVGAVPVPVTLDNSGIEPASLTAGLDRAPVALLLQPRAQNPTGVSMTPQRAAELAAVIARHPLGRTVAVVEDDHAGEIASAAPVSLGEWLPDQVVHIRSYSKSHGPDLRLAAVGGPAALVASVADRRLLGPGWSSRVLQAVLLDLLTDPATVRFVSGARREYARRRGVLTASLSHRGVDAPTPDGINMWIPVRDQQHAMLSLAAHGIAVAPGTPFAVSPLGGDHVRLTVGLVRDGFDDLADLLADAAGGPHRASGRRLRTLRRTTR